MIIPENPEDAVAEVIEGGNPASIGWTSTSHTNQNVGVWAYVPEGVSLIEGLNPDLGDSQSTRENYIIDNTDIAPWCAEFMGVDLDELSKELFVNVSSIGKYNSLTKQFVFNNGDKYIYITIRMNIIKMAKKFPQTARLRFISIVNSMFLPK